MVRWGKVMAGWVAPATVTMAVEVATVWVTVAVMVVSSVLPSRSVAVMVNVELPGWRGTRFKDVPSIVAATAVED